MSGTERPHETVDKKTRKQVLERDDHRCQFCRKKGLKYGGSVHLEVHHMDREPDDIDVHDLRNLTTLCRGCHSWHHQKTESDELPVELADEDEAALKPRDKAILKVLVKQGPMRLGDIRAELPASFSGDSIRERMWILMGLDNKVENREEQIVDQDIDTGEYGLAEQIGESARGRIPDDPQRLVLRYEDEMVRRAVERGETYESVANVFGFSERTAHYKKNRAFAYDFPLDAFQSGRRGWNGGGVASDEEVEEAAIEEAVTESGEDVEVWSGSDTNESVTAAEMLDDAETKESNSVSEGEKAGPSAHLDRAISALKEAKSAL